MFKSAASKRTKGAAKLYGVDSFKVLFEKVASHFAENDFSVKMRVIRFTCERIGHIEQRQVHQWLEIQTRPLQRDTKRTLYKMLIKAEHYQEMQ